MARLDSPYLVVQDVTPAGRRTKVLQIRGRSQGGVLAEVQWHGPWRQYCLFTVGFDVVCNGGCLKSLVAFLDELNREFRQTALERRRLKAEENPCDGEPTPTASETPTLKGEKDGE